MTCYKPENEGDSSTTTSRYSELYLSVLFQLPGLVHLSSQSQPEGSVTLPLRLVLYTGIFTRSGGNIKDDFSTLLGQTGKTPLIECHK